MDGVGIPDGEEQPLACFEDDKKWNFWSQDAYKNLAKYLETKN